jgi:hypothetical protein
MGAQHVCCSACCSAVMQARLGEYQSAAAVAVLQHQLITSPSFGAACYGILLTICLCVGCVSWTGDNHCCGWLACIDSTLPLKITDCIQPTSRSKPLRPLKTGERALTNECSLTHFRNPVTTSLLVWACCVHVVQNQIALLNNLLTRLCLCPHLQRERQQQQCNSSPQSDHFARGVWVV